MLKPLIQGTRDTQSLLGSGLPVWAKSTWLARYSRVALPRSSRLMLAMVKSIVSFLNRMNMQMLTPSVRAVPASAHQRIDSSQPLGKNSNPKANTLGRKMTNDIQSISVSGMGASTQAGRDYG